ncbi:hypothetical protein HYU13_04770 [Candidatus Woesearchaeota archaeon]|nr:hypothetical protein [Candidatus Woesearchaeota archaeon]
MFDRKVLNRIFGKKEVVKMVKSTQHQHQIAMKPAVIATSGTFGALYILCAILVGLFPRQATILFNNLFHGFEFSGTMMRNGISLTTTAAGFVEVVILGTILAWLFVTLYNNAIKQ